MSNELKLKVAADVSGAAAAFEKIGTSAKKAKKEVAAVAKSSGLSAEWKAASKAAENYARSVDQASRKTATLARQTSAWRSALGVGLKAAAGAIGAGAIGAAGVMAVKASADRQSAVGRLAGSLGSADAAAAAGNSLSAWGAANNADPTELLRHTDKLVKAGLSANQAMEAVKAAVISSAGDVGKVESIIEPLTEFASKGFIETEILDKFAELGVDLRAGLQEQLGLNRDQLEKAVADHTVTAEAAVAAMQKITAAGTKLHDSHQQSLAGMAGAMATIARQFEEMKIKFGDGIASGLQGTFATLGQDMGSAISQFSTVVQGAGLALGTAVSAVVSVIHGGAKAIVNAADWVAEKFGGDLVSDNWDSGKPATPADFIPHDDKKRAAIRATEARRAAASSVAAERLAARDAAAAAELQKNLDALAVKLAPASSTDRRTAISHAAGFGGAAVTSADLTRKLESSGASKLLARQRRAAELEATLGELAAFGLTENSTADDFAAAAAGDWQKEASLAALQNKIDSLAARAGIAPGATNAAVAASIRDGAKADLASTRSALALANMREELQLLEEQEKKTAEIVADYDRRMAIQDAILAGDRERADLLTQQMEAEKLATEYASRGVDLATAQRMAAAEVARNFRPSGGSASAFDPFANNVRLKETISSPLANIGGGGTRIRFYENQQIKAATDTATNTANIASAATAILTHLQTKSQTAILA